MAAAELKPAAPGAEPPATLRRPLAASVWIAGVFCVLVGLTMIGLHFRATTNDPWKSPQLLALKARLGNEPKNEPLKLEIRRLDLQFRERFRHRLTLDISGGWLLVGGTLALVLTARTVFNLDRKVLLPQPKPDAAGQAVRTAARARWAVAATGGAAAVALAVISLALGTALPAREADVLKLSGSGAALEAVAVPLPPPEEWQANSPRFRGWDGNGVSTQTNAPLAWDGKSGNGIAWKTAILAPGHNSPVVWGDHVFLAGATLVKREVFCYAAASGQLVWRRALENVPGSPAKPVEVPEGTGYAAPTMATDGRRAYVIFANGDLAALNFDGSIAWSRALGPINNSYGYASSLAIWQSRVIVLLDQGENKPADSKLMAFDGATGRVVWERSRPVPVSWATPVVIEAAGKAQIITLGVPWLISYSLADGNELWRAELLDGEVVPSPIFAGGLVIAASPSSKLLALRPEGAGDVTKTHLAWSTDENVPDITSPVSAGGLIFTVTSGGVLTCFDIRDGKKVWEHDLGFDVRASPAIAGDRLFVMGLKGTAVVIGVAREYKEIARSAVADSFFATPAFATGRLFLRGQTNLYCIAPLAGREEKGGNHAGH